MSKQNGSFRLDKTVHKAIGEAARLENRSFNNMLEELVKRGLGGSRGISLTEYIENGKSRGDE